MNQPATYMLAAVAVTIGTLALVLVALVVALMVLRPQRITQAAAAVLCVQLLGAVQVAPESLSSASIRRRRHEICNR